MFSILCSGSFLFLYMLLRCVSWYLFSGGMFGFSSIFSISCCVLMILSSVYLIFSFLYPNIRYVLVSLFVLFRQLGCSYILTMSVMYIPFLMLLLKLWMYMSLIHCGCVLLLMVSL